MANENEAIGILFGVEGGGDIDKGSGALIKEKIGEIVKKLNSDDVVKIKFQVDTKHVSKQLKDQLQDVVKNVTKSAESKKSAQSSSSKEELASVNAAKKAIKEYFSVKTKYERKSSRTSNPSREYKELAKNLKEAKKNGQEYFTVLRGGSIKLKDDIDGITEAQRASLKEFVKSNNMQFKVDKKDITKSAEQSWSNLTQKVHDYVDRVEYAASRDKNAAQGLRELRDMANSTDYHGYDELKKKLAEVEQYINKNELATETWGQKMVKTFGSRVRSALAGVMTAKLAQWLNDIYKNVVNLDKAMTNLQIASGKTREEVKELILAYSKLGRQLGATTSQVAESADTWLRQGHSVNDTNTLITNSMMLSKLGQLESAEAATALTSAMKGYNISVQDSIRIVDKWTAVDMIAAANAGDMATAMSQTATSAQIAGVSMDTLIGYIATVKEVTQDSAESVGTFYKTLFARMNNVAAGNFVDEETGESLNDVEKVLNELGISLRDTNGQFRSSSEILSEVGNRWESFDTIQQHAIATAMAGTRQQEKFIVLMQNYETAMKYAETSTKSAGTAQEKFSNYTESVEGKLASLTSTFEELSMTVLHAEWIVTGVEMLTGLVSILNSIASIGDGAVVAIIAIAAAIAGIIGVSTLASASIRNLILHHAKLQGVQVGATVTTEAFTAALKHLSSTGILGVLLAIPKFLIAAVMWGASITGLTAKTYTFKAAMDALNLNPVVLGITAAITAITLLTVGIKAASDASENYNAQKKQVIEHTYEVTKTLKEERDELDNLIQSYYELAEANKGVYDVSEREQILEIQEQINTIIDDETKKVDLLGTSYENLKGTMQSLYSSQADQVAKDIEIEREQISKIEQQALDDFKKRDPILKYYDEVSIGTNYEKSGDGDDYIYVAYGDSLSDFKNNLEEAKKQYYETTDDITKKTIDDWLALIDEYEPAIQHHKEAISSMIIELENAKYKASSGFGGDNGILDALSEYSELKRHLQEAVKNNEDFIGTEEEKLEAIDEFMRTNYADVYAQIANETFSANYQLKTFSSLVDESTEAWDALSAAEEEMNNSGALSLDTVQKLKDVLSDEEEAEFFERTEDGYYKLKKDAADAKGALDRYIDAQKEKLLLIMASNSEDSEAYKNAKQNYEDLIVISQTYSLENEIEKATKRLEDQLDGFEEMIDLRKELLRTYKEEVDYQNELEKKQKAVTDVSARLAVSRLDTSAEGQAETRRLEEELQAAEEELEEFTLEHAIDVLTNELELQKQEYNNLIHREIDGLKNAITGKLNELISAEEAKTEYVANLSDEEKNKIDMNKTVNTLNDYIAKNGVTSESELDADGQEMYTNAKTAYEKVHGTGTWENSEAVKWAAKPNHPEVSNPFVSLSDFSAEGNVRNVNGDNFELKKDNVRYRLQVNTGLGLTNADLATKAVGGSPKTGSVVYNKDDKHAYVYTDKNYWFRIEARDNSYQEDYANFMNLMPSYHTGGLVGDISTLSSSEEFAKLLKGEFVSTPAQMKRFMEKTLPDIANYTSSEGGNEFNAPLVEIKCDSITSESLPRVEKLVAEAVKEVRKIFESGMSRTGYKKAVKTL